MVLKNYTGQCLKQQAFNLQYGKDYCQKSDGIQPQDTVMLQRVIWMLTSWAVPISVV